MFIYKKLLLTFLTLCIFKSIFSQSNPVVFTNGKDRLKATDQRKVLKEKSILQHIDVKNIGPTVFSGRVSDIVHPREKDLIIATHGRSIYKTNVKPVEILVSDTLLEDELVIFDLDEVRFRSRWGTQTAIYREPIEPEVNITIYSKNSGKATFQIIAGDDLILVNEEINLERGIQQILNHLAIDDANKTT